MDTTSITAVGVGRFPLVATLTLPVMCRPETARASWLSHLTFGQMAIRPPSTP